MERNSSPAISVIVPVYNEEKNLPELYRRLKDALLSLQLPHELIFVNDGSKDKSLLELLRLGQEDDSVFYINFSRNFGHQIAVTAGLDACRGACAVIIDGDLQDPPELIPDLYRKYQEGHEVVYAQRASRDGDGYFKKITAKLFYRILRASTSTDIPLDTGDFRLIDRKVIDYLKQMPEQNKFLRGQIAWLGFRQTHVLFHRDSRRHGTSGYPLGKMLRFAMDGITGFSDAPLQLVTRLGFTISAVSFLIILYAVYSHFLLHRTITGWTSLIISSMFIGGVQLLSIGVIGEYVSRINRNVLNRPLYIVQGSNLGSQSAVIAPQTQAVAVPS
ncbi:glycosyltransferase [Nibribacter ruber]|uniref:Glycosyltransferase n=1 Tax=Nibribacter ruber TaxID=2698458 RepID=A0A6P1NZR8_9BACT|nr:glycosyltransferase family 2 protein [Nibribacter ruber]QHL88024.1 glycosyltransferase [Nibribacter ruber]